MPNRAAGRQGEYIARYAEPATAGVLRKKGRRPGFLGYDWSFSGRQEKGMARGIGRWAAVGVGVVALVLAFKLLPVDTWLLELVGHIRGTGMAGSVLYIVLYLVATMLVMPASVLTLGAGFAYGPVHGSLLVVLASNLSALAAFLLGRTALRERVGRYLASQPGFTAVDAAVASQGFKVVLLLRLSPLFPFSLLNYSLGLTRVRTRDYVLASSLGLLPGTALYVYLGSLVKSVAQLTRGERPDAGPSGLFFFWGGLTATALVTVYVTRLARRALDATLRQQQEFRSLREPAGQAPGGAPSGTTRRRARGSRPFPP